MENPSKFPHDAAASRIGRYRLNDMLFTGEHKLAFNAKIDDPRYSQDYQKLRYIAANFAGLISKMSADFLMGEQVGTKWNNKQSREWANALFFENSLHTQFYESELLNSRRGDALFKVRTGFRRKNDSDLSLILEDINPAIYFPHINGDNVRQKPDVEELCWKVRYGDNWYLRKEIHEPGLIRNELWKLKGENSSELDGPAAFSEIGIEIEAEVETGIDRSLLIHIPNWKDGTRFWGYDDYGDLLSLFFALNNRLTKTDNILDQHADPILALPEGVLDDDGKVKREALKMVEIPNLGGTSGGQTKPEYITWNAQLEAVWSEFDRIERLLYMFSETSPDAFGMGKGQNDSGRALKLRLMRTLAKINRKRLYYDAGIKELLVVAQELGKAQGVKVMGLQAGETEVPELEWSDGIPQDYVETVETEVARVDGGLSSAQSAIQRIDGIDEESAQKELARIDAESTVTSPESSPSGDFIRKRSPVPKPKAEPEATPEPEPADARS